MAVLIPDLKYRFTDSCSSSSVPIDPMVCVSVLLILLFLLVPKPVDQKCLIYEIETSVINVLSGGRFGKCPRNLCVSPWAQGQFQQQPDIFSTGFIQRFGPKVGAN